MSMSFLLIVLTPAVALGAAFEIAPPFGDHMVLPMGRAVPVWGTAEPGTGVKVQFAGASAQAKADESGQWFASLPAMPAAADGQELEIRYGGETLTLRDVLVGQVWLCSGQSNMDFPLARAVGGKEEADRANQFESIRLCNLQGAPTDARRYDDVTRARLNPQEHFRGSWQRPDSGSAGGFSAVAWWTARLVHEETGVPIGLVDNSVGGSGAEAWLPSEILQSRPEYHELLEETWLESEKLSPWARGRARQNLGDETCGNHPYRPGFLFESGVRPWAKFPFHAVL